MSKIKGWRKVINTKRRIEWFSENGGYSIKVREQSGTYLVTLGSLNNYRRTKTKNKAIKIAINYMKKHPRG